MEWALSLVMDAQCARNEEEGTPCRSGGTAVAKRHVGGHQESCVVMMTALQRALAVNAKVSDYRRGFRQKLLHTESYCCCCCCSSDLRLQFARYSFCVLWTRNWLWSCGKRKSTSYCHSPVTEKGARRQSSTLQSYVRSNLRMPASGNITLLLF